MFPSNPFLYSLFYSMLYCIHFCIFINFISIFIYYKHFDRYIIYVCIVFIFYFELILIWICLLKRLLKGCFSLGISSSVLAKTFFSFSLIVWQSPKYGISFSSFPVILTMFKSIMNLLPSLFFSSFSFNNLFPLCSAF